MSVVTVGLWYILCVLFSNSLVCTALADSIKGKVSYQFSYEDPWKRQWPPVWWSWSEHLFSKTVPMVKELNSKYWETAYWKYMFLNKSEYWKTMMCGALVLLTFFCVCSRLMLLARCLSVQETSSEDTSIMSSTMIMAFQYF